MCDVLAPAADAAASQIAVPYDWRLPIPMMEKRDGFFTRVKTEVELQYQLSEGIKPVLISHSYGATVTTTFLHWVESQSPGWVDKHLAAYLNLAGPLLGLPKALSPMLSGACLPGGHLLSSRSAVLVEPWRETGAVLSCHAVRVMSVRLMGQRSHSVTPNHVAGQTFVLPGSIVCPHGIWCIAWVRCHMCTARLYCLSIMSHVCTAGETRETVDMMAGLAVLVEQYLGKQSRAAVSVCRTADGGPRLVSHAVWLLQYSCAGCGIAGALP